MASDMSSLCSNGKIANYKRLIVFASISNRLTLNFHTRKVILILLFLKKVNYDE